MATQCTPTQLPFHPFGRREVVVRFDAGHLTSDGGALLLREADPTGAIGRRARAEELVAQRATAEPFCCGRRTRPVWSGLGRGTGGMPWPGRAR